MGKDRFVVFRVKRTVDRYPIVLFLKDTVR